MAKQIKSRIQNLLHKEQLLEEANEAYRKMKEHPEAWQEEQDERALWDATLADGLENL